MAFVSEWHSSPNGIRLRMAFVSEWHSSPNGKKPVKTRSKSRNTKTPANKKTTQPKRI